MTNHAFSETLTFTRRSNWNTDTCSHLTATHMQLSIMNQPTNWLMLDDKTVDELNGMCDGCERFMRKQTFGCHHDF
jgi:hypothetical protein